MKEQSAGAEAEVASSAGPVQKAPPLLRALGTDPARMPEHLAVFAIKHMGPRAKAARERSVEGPKAASDGAVGRATVHEREAAVRRATRRTAAEGAILGGPFIIFAPAAFCGALLTQARMVLELAEIDGRSATDEARAADLLVLQNAYPTLAEAQAALTALRESPRPEGQRFPRGARVAMVKRMGVLLGLWGQDLGDGPRWRRMLGTLVMAGWFVVGFFLPWVWIPVLGFLNGRSTLDLAHRTIAYYRAEDAADAGIAVVEARPAQPSGGDTKLVRRAGAFVILGRTLIGAALPFLAVVAVILADIHVAHHVWLAVLIALVGVSIVAGLIWLPELRRRARGGGFEGERAGEG